MQIVHTGIPMERIAADIMGELPETENGNKYIVVVSDYFTKWTESFAMPNMEARTVAKIIVEEVIVMLHCLQGSRLNASAFACFLPGLCCTTMSNDANTSSHLAICPSGFLKLSNH
jgi:hypothetical protein